MADLYHMDPAELRRLRRFYKQAPKLFTRAAAATLNGFAFGNRKESREIIHSEMQVRNPKFIDGSLKVEKSKANVPMNKMAATFGAVHRPRFTGLREQELGLAGSRNRLFTTAAREGSMKNPTRAYARLKPNAKYPSPNNPNGLKTRGSQDFDLSGLTGAKRIVAFLSILNESKRDQTFIIRRKFGRFKRGLYRYKQGKIKKLQSFDKKDKPRRVRWLTKGRQAFMTKANILNTWAKSINYQLKKHK